MVVSYKIVGSFSFSPPALAALIEAAATERHLTALAELAPMT